jgi:hypothetical protein
MAEIFKNPDLILTPSVNEQSAGGREHTGINEVDAYINSLPEDEREEALLAITAPKTGEDIHNEMLAADQAGAVFDPAKEDWLKLNQFYRTRDTDYLMAISEGAGHIYETFGKAMTSLADDPSMENFSKITPSVFEGAAQNLRMLYGIAAESADSTSMQAKFFNLLNGRTEDSDEAYRVFLEARHFNRESQQYAEGKKTILTDKRHLNNDFVQAAALVADPTMFIPFGKAFSLAGGVLGMSERSMVLAARTANLKNKLVGGAIKYGVGMPIEFIGKGTRVTLDHAIATGEKAFVAATGVSSEVFREGMRMSGVGSLGAGYFGHSVPLLTSASGAYVAGTAAAGVGEAVSVIGHQIMKGERGIASYAKQALIDSAKQGVELSTHSKALLKIVDGFDPLIDYTTTMAQGAAHGSMIGAGLGYWSGGEEGMAQGIGAGIALGSVGGTAGRLLADVTGRTTRHRTHIQAKLVLEGLRDIHPEQAHSWERAEAWARSRGFSLDGILAAKDTIHPNTHIEVLTNKEYANYLAEHGLNPDTYDGKTFLKDGDQPLSLRSFEQQNGYVVENRANGTVKIYLNADAAPRATMGHELFHSILRNSVMKDYYAQAVKEKVIGSRDAEGNLTNRGVVDIAEVKEMFRRYLDAEFKDPAERADAQARLDMAEAAFESNGQLVSDPSLGGRPLLEHLSEEFGAYYFSHLVMDKPIDWLYHGGDLPGIRGVLDNAKMLYQNYWRSRMNLTAPEFDFNRTFIDEAGYEKLVPIDEVFAPAARDMFGNITGKTKRVVNPAMDLFFRDMLRIEKKVNETGQFEISRLDKRSQERFIESEGLDGIFTKDVAGNYQHSTEAQIKRENRIKGKAVYQLLMGVPEAERTFVIDADGNIRGHLTPQMLDNIVNAGHMSRAMANKISLFQSISRGEAAGNIVDFGGIGATAERPMDVNNPSRMYGKRVPYKNRTAIVFGLETVIGKNGKFQFKGNMLDYKVIETRANNEWSNLDVQRLWNGNHTEYLADFFRYLENASKSHDDATRVPSAELWTDGKGGERRNVLHQILGMAKGEADTFLNSPKAEINRNAYSTVMSFSLNRMTNLRLRNQSVPFKFENAYRDLVRNWSPAEMDSELTPRGTVFKHPSGFKFVQREDGKTDAFDELGKRIGTYQTAAEATEAGRKYALKHPSTVMLKDNMTDNSVINRSPNQGEGEVPYRGGDDYWKPEANIFEYKDEQGLIVRKPVVGDKRNPDNVLWMEIGHGWQRGNEPVASEVYMWGYNDKNVDNSYVNNNSGWQLKKFNIDGNNKAHEQLAKFQTSSYQGRIELPENGQKGRISILDRGFRDDPEISLKKAKNIKEGLISRIQKQLKKEGSDVVLNPEDFDAYLFHPSKEVKASFGLGKKDKLPVKFSPNQGEGELPLISRSEAAEARRIGDLFNTEEMREFVGDRMLVRQTADEGFTDFIKNWDNVENLSKETALMMLDEMSNDMFGGLDRQTNRLRLNELYEKARVGFDEANPKMKGLYKELPDRRLKEYLPISEYIEAKRLEEALAKPATQKQLHSEFTVETAREFAQKIREARKWIEKAMPSYNDFAGYIRDNVPLREYYQHAVYSKQFKTGKPVVVVGVHGTYTSKGFLKDRRYKHELREQDLPLSEGERRGAYFASSDATALNPEYQGYDPKKVGYEFSPAYRRPESDSPNIGKSAIRFDNPLVVDGQQTPMMKRTEKILGEAIEAGHDGVIYINQTDGGGLDVTFILPVETANKQQRMIGSTREKAKAGASYEPLPRGEGVTNRTVNLSPNQGAGELPISREGNWAFPPRLGSAGYREDSSTTRFGVPREEPIYRDSLGYYEQFAIDRSRELPFDPTYFESLVTKNRGKKGVEATLNFDNAPNPKYHNLWQYLDYHQQAKSTVTVGDVLNFIKEQGIHTAPNMPVDIHSKYAQMLLALADTNQLNVSVDLSQTGSWTGGENIVTMTRQYQQILLREATLRERYNILTAQYQKAPTVELKKELANIRKHLEGTKKEKEKQKEDIKEASEERRLRDEDDAEDGDTEQKETYRFPIRMVREKKSHQQMFLNLAELIDKTWAADRYKHTLGNHSGSEFSRRQQALQGMSIEGTALEELGHSIFGRISREAGEAAPELAALINTDGITSISGDAWKHNVNKFLGKTKQQIKDGIILPPSVVAFARILELQKYAAENTYIMNPKGTIETLWESKGYKLNDNVYTDKGKLKSNRGALKKGYRIINPWEFDNTGKNRFKGDQEYNVPNSWKELSVYRLGSTQEFMIALLNDPTHLARWNHMPVNLDLLVPLNTPDVKAGFQRNVESLHRQMNEALTEFVGYEGTFSHQILEEMIRVINAGREGAGSNAPADIQRVDVGNKRGVQKSKLPVRPKGFLTPYEKAFVNDWRVNMERWAEANGKPNALEGLSDFEIWERVGENKPPFEGSDEAMKDPALWKVNSKDISESQIQGVSNEWIRENAKKYAEKTKELEESRKNLRVARWNEDLQKWEMIEDTEATGVDTTTDPIVDPVEKDKDTTVDPDRDKDTTVDPDKDKDTTVDPDRDKDGGGRDRKKDRDGKDKDRDGRDGKPPVPPAPIPKRTFTDADIRVWRSWKTETYGNGSALKNALGYIIMSVNKNYRVYNPEKVLIGIYKDEEEAKRRVQREEPKR